MEKKMEFRGGGYMEKKMETTTVYWGYMDSEDNIRTIFLDFKPFCAHAVSQTVTRC